MATNCQVCGNPMFSQNDMGLNTDGSVNTDYCSNCYKNGNFTNKYGDGDQSGFTAFPFAPMVNQNDTVTGQNYAPFAFININNDMNSKTGR